MTPAQSAPYVPPLRDRQDEGKAITVREGYIPFDVDTHGVRQPDRISCGVAATATVARLLGRGDDLVFSVLCQDLKPQFKIGTEQEDVLKLARREFQGVTGGENTYPGGLAIASLTHFEIRPEGSGHYVVFLGIEEGVVRYYCPYLHSVVEKSLEEVVWMNSDRTYNRWSVNFPVNYSIQGG